MNPSSTAIVMIGYQNDYFRKDGLLHGVIESSASTILSRTLTLIQCLQLTPVTLIHAPIYFLPDYSELIDTIGILKIIRDVGAFKIGSPGSETILELAAFNDRMVTVNGKRGLNAFHSTTLQDELDRRNITDVVLAGVVTPLCIDSTARSAFEKGYRVTVLSDCTAGRTQYEQDFYCNEILPLYTTVMTFNQLYEKLQVTL